MTIPKIRKLLLFASICFIYSTFFAENAFNCESFRRHLEHQIDFQKTLEGIDRNIPIPENLHIVFVGDSLTRYQYLSLCHYMKYGEWADPDEKPNFVWQTDHGTWMNFFKASNKVLSPNEECDCWRPEEHGVALAPKWFENRYFLDPVRNNSLSMITKLGGTMDFKSQWAVSDIHNPHTFKDNMEDLNYDEYRESTWEGFIRDFVAKMEPKPDYMVFNSGLWDHQPEHNEEVSFRDSRKRNKIVQALKDAGIVSIYKTTTKAKGETDPTMRHYEHEMCEIVDYCFDLTYTSQIPKEYRMDRVHFREPIYSLFNIQLLDLISRSKRDSGYGESGSGDSYDSSDGGVGGFGVYSEK